MPLLGFGTWQVGQEAVEAALAAGYRSIDTATAYRNEAAVGRAVRASGVRREEVFVTTKVPNQSHGRESTLRELDRSLERLGFDQVDLYLIHWPQPEQGLYVETWQTLEELQARGLATAIGVSNFEIDHLEALTAAGCSTPAVNQIELNPRRPQAARRRYHDAHGMVTEAWAPIGQGGRLLADPVVAEVASAHGRTPAQVILRWHLEQGIVAIPRSSSPDRIRQNADVFSFELTDAQMHRLSALGR
jgi:2,5-diketo-D-gluconate reductase A